MENGVEGKWMKELVCSVTRVAYDFDERTGYLWMARLHCCHAPGCFALFESIDPDVRVIYTISGEKQDTIYRREENGWKTYMPKDA